jgi:hypothetical protein
VNKNRRWLRILVLGAVLILAIGAAAFFILENAGIWSTRKPSIIILQPQSPQTIQNDQGIHFIVLASSRQGIERIAFFENDNLQNLSYSPNPGQRELVSQLAWLPDGIGTYTLKWVAYDMENNASDPVSITIGVISPGLSQADADKIRTGVEASEVVLAAGSDFDDRQSDSEGQHALILGGERIQQAQEMPAGDGGDGQGLDQEPGQDVGLPIEEDQRGDPIAEQAEHRPDVSDLPPEIVSFETNLQREGDGVRLTVDVSASDDNGLEAILIVDYQEGEPFMPIQLAHPCHAQASCSASANALLSPGVHDIIVSAKDTLGQDSRTYRKNIEISQNLEVDAGPAIVESADPEEISWDFLRSIAQHFGDIFQMQPFRNIEIIDVQDGIDSLDTTCEPHTIFDAQLGVRQYWDVHLPFLEIDCFFPCQMQADSDDAMVCVEAADIGLHCSWEDRDMLCRIHIAGLKDQHFSGYHVLLMYDPDFHWSRNMCGMGSTKITPAIAVENEIIQRGDPFEFEPLPCPPMGVNVQVFSTENCPEGSADEDYCLWVGMVPKQPRIARERLDIDHFYIKETIFVARDIIVNEYIQPADEYNLVFNNPRRGYLHEYEVYAVSAEGIRSEKTLVNMRVPALGDNSYRSSNHWHENR